MLNRIQLFQSNWQNFQKKSNTNTNLPRCQPDRFIRTSKPVSFQGGLDYVRVAKNYFRGPKPNHITLEALKAEGINTIIDFTAGIEEALKRKIRELGMNYHNIPLDETVNPTEEQIEAFRKIVGNPEASVYAHCREGRNRTGIMTAIYLVLEKGRDFRSAYSHMLKNNYDYINHPNLGECLESICIKNGEDAVKVKEIAQGLRSNFDWQRSLSQFR